MRRRALATLALAGTTLARAATVPAGGAPIVEPLAGLHEVELCVAVGAAEPGCGPAEAIVDPAGEISIRISDIVYRIGLHDGAVGVVVMHGTMQIDGFVAPGSWAGTRLQFHDKAKGARYELRFAEGSVRTRRQDSR